jgi:hypothetical protein
VRYRDARKVSQLARPVKRLCDFHDTAATGNVTAAVVWSVEFIFKPQFAAAGAFVNSFDGHVVVLSL